MPKMRRGPRDGRTGNRLAPLLVLLLILGLLYAGAELAGRLSAPPRNSEPESAPSAAAIADAFRSEASGVTVEAAGVIERLLPDDRVGSRHQRFIVRLDDGHTVLVSHNIDLAPRVPAEEGDQVRFRGQYEWNERGGVVHWTHHDPQGRRRGGFVRHRGRVYE